MRRQIENEADVKARERFRLFVVLYLAYPAIIMTLLLVIGAGAWWIFRNDPGPVPDEVAWSGEPPWCSSPVGAPVAYGPASQAEPPLGGGSGYEPAIPPGGMVPPAFGGGPNTFGTGVQNATSAAAARISYYVAESVRAADGSLEARWRRDRVSLSQVEVGVARQRFIERSRKEGKLGFYRLGITQLGGEVYEIAQIAKLTVPFCKPNDFVIADKGQAFVSFSIAKYCDTQQATRAKDWLLAIAEYEDYSPEQVAVFEAQARTMLAAEPMLCEGFPTSDTGPAPPPDDAPGHDLGSGLFEDEPCEADDAACINREKSKGAAALARSKLNLGDAALAQGDLKSAQLYWMDAIQAGRATGSQAAITAQKRLQTRMLTCNFTPESLKAISRDYKARSGDLIHMKVVQKALHALGHYDGPIDGGLSIVTRASIRKFQREMEFDETDSLTPMQTVYLLCNAGETARDLASQNALGIMYATGLGVEQNIDIALEWLRTASQRGYADATFNLSVLYGSGVVLKSYRLCQIPRSPEQADQYLREAVHQKHPIATALWKRYGPNSVPPPKTALARWEKIEREQLIPSKGDPTNVYENKLLNIGTGCPPTKDIR